jgi:hypothetical protein
MGKRGTQPSEVCGIVSLRLLISCHPCFHLLPPLLVLLLVFVFGFLLMPTLRLPFNGHTWGRGIRR